MLRRQRRLIGIKSTDGFLIHSLLVTGEHKNREQLSKSPVILLVHGVLGHFLARGTPRQMPNILMESGISSFSINTRMAYLGQITGHAIFDDSAYDIDAAVGFLKSEGFRNIFILGFSLGANIAAYYASIRPESGIRGLILEGCAYSLPDSQRKRWNRWKSVPSYDEVYTKAKEILGPDPISSANDRIFLVNRAWGDTFRPYHNEIFTYKTWWFMRSPEADNAKTYKIITGVKAPILFLQGGNDDILERRECHELAELARRAGNGDVKVQYIPEAEHDCMENPDATIKAVVSWVRATLRKYGAEDKKTGP